jgi:hypothetical protein
MFFDNEYYVSLFYILLSSFILCIFELSFFLKVVVPDMDNQMNGIAPELCELIYGGLIIKSAKEIASVGAGAVPPELVTAGKEGDDLAAVKKVASKYGRSGGQPVDNSDYIEKDNSTMIVTAVFSLVIAFIVLLRYVYTLVEPDSFGFNEDLGLFIFTLFTLVMFNIYFNVTYRKHIKKSIEETRVAPSTTT